MPLFIYYVTRPYCEPSFCLVLAENALQAHGESNKAFGYCDGTARRLKNIKGVLPLKNDNNTIYPKFEKS